MVPRALDGSGLVARAAPAGGFPAVRAGSALFLPYRRQRASGRAVRGERRGGGSPIPYFESTELGAGPFRSHDGIRIANHGSFTAIIRVTPSVGGSSQQHTIVPGGFVIFIFFFFF